MQLHKRDNIENIKDTDMMYRIKLTLMYIFVLCKHTTRVNALCKLMGFLNGYFVIYIFSRNTYVEEINK